MLQCNTLLYIVAQLQRALHIDIISGYNMTKLLTDIVSLGS
jgi:hypothetical protein